MEDEGSEIIATRDAEKKERAKNNKGQESIETMDRMCATVLPDGPEQVEVTGVPPHVVLPPGSEEQAAAQMKDRSISAAGCIRRPPVRYGFEEMRGASEEEMVLFSRESTLRELTPVTSPVVSPEISLGSNFDHNLIQTCYTTKMASEMHVAPQIP